MAAPGENLLLLVNLAWTAWIDGRVLRGRAPVGVLDRWQVACLPVYSLWDACVAVVFPPLFGCR